MFYRSHRILFVTIILGHVKLVIFGRIEQLGLLKPLQPKRQKCVFKIRKNERSSINKLVTPKTPKLQILD
ncbi:hypothetical protein L596_028722 [Steinernema carpocapsae]|uniref:Uncharacterized protein n=1 Tax=Steinernema carpocapsae TaxID=34508 RepID=A0A4U5LZ71_STECR|nr:hypothetical protein L596_028722 [Steinernema carpocapsae]